MQKRAGELGWHPFIENYQKYINLDVRNEVGFQISVSDTDSQLCSCWAMVCSGAAIILFMASLVLQVSSSSEYQRLRKYPNERVCTVQWYTKFTLLRQAFLILTPLEIHTLKSYPVYSSDPAFNAEVGVKQQDPCGVNFHLTHFPNSLFQRTVLSNREPKAAF